MSDKIEPALTPEEWAHVLPYKPYLTAQVDDQTFSEPLQVEAIALQQERLGWFTREDVNLLIRSMPETGTRVAELEDLAARIEALLPPEGK